MNNLKRIVIKVGTSSLTHENGKVNYRQMEHLVRVISDLKNQGYEVVLVSSGAISVGQNKLGLSERPKETRQKQATAAVGQCDLMYTYSKLFSEYSHCVGQILLTKDVIEDENRKTNAINTLNCLLETDAVPIVNENDTISTYEIEFGDNDHLSAIVSVLCNADLLVILTDTNGLYDSDPHKNPDAKLIERVDNITPELFSIAGGSGTRRGTGGMQSKLDAADFATKNGIDMVIMSGANPEKIYDLLDGQSVGTLFTKI